jgi:DNA mismatch repair protein MutS
VVERAQIILAKLEAGDTRQPVGSLIDDLPLFAAAQAPAPRPEARDELADALGDINPDELTPRAALDALYALKRLAGAKANRKP